MRTTDVKIASLLVLGLAALGIAACARQAGPMGPGGLVLGQDFGNKDLPTVSAFTAPGSNSGTAFVRFSTPMNPATLVKNQSVTVYRLDSAATSETRYDAWTLGYNATSKAMAIIPDNHLWANDVRYRVEIRPDAKSVGNQPLDGNNNSIPEPAEFDSYMNQFWVGAGAGPFYVFGPIGVNSASLYDGASSAFTAGGYYGGVDYHDVTITVTFNDALDIYPGDPYNVVNGSALPWFITFADQNGTPVAPVYVTVTGGSYNILAFGCHLNPDTQYAFSIRGGLNGLRSGGNASRALMRGRFFDGSGNGKAEASDDYKSVTFKTLPSSGPVPRTYVTSITADGLGSGGGNRRLVVAFNASTASGQLDPAWVNSSNFILLDYETSRGITASRIELDNTLAYAPVVYIYIPNHYFNAEAGGRNVQLVISRNVRSLEGVTLDQNNDGVSGTPLDDVMIRNDNSEPASLGTLPLIWNF